MSYRALPLVLVFALAVPLSAAFDVPAAADPPSGSPFDFIPAEALTGWGPADHPKLGFAYAVYDRELGVQTFTIGTEFPFESDPSLWATLEMVRS